VKSSSPLLGVVFAKIVDRRDAAGSFPWAVADPRRNVGVASDPAQILEPIGDALRRLAPEGFSGNTPNRSSSPLRCSAERAE
jgi:hypothetical protein